jgi:electron transfer flavoprotein beta subunit
MSQDVPQSQHSIGSERQDLNIVVCVKQVLDPEISPVKFRIDELAKKVIPPKLDSVFVINPFDELAVEAALRIKDIHAAKVTVLSLGDESAKVALKHTLAMGVDDGILINVDNPDAFDSRFTASVLSGAIRKLQHYDLILCGRQAGDWDNGQVPLGVAELLGIPSITPCQKIEIHDEVYVERVTDNGYDILKVSTPCVLSISNELGLARLPTVSGILSAMKKQLITWTMDDLAKEITLDNDDRAPGTELIQLFVPLREQNCLFVGGESSEESGINLALRLREDKII